MSFLFLITTKPMRMIKQSVILILRLLTGYHAPSKIRVLEKSDIKNGLKSCLNMIGVASYRFVIANGAIQFFGKRE